MAGNILVMPQAPPEGYLAIPPAEKGRAVLVLHAWWGLNQTIRSFCDRLAAEGFVAFAPHLYHGKVAATIAEAEALSKLVDGNPDQAKAAVVEAGKFLRDRAGAAEFAVMGFSLGAYFAADLSTADPEHVRAVVLYYGTAPGDYSKARAAYLGHFAENDPYEPQEYADRLESELRRVGRPATFHRYPGTGHWFVEPDRVDQFNPDAAQLAWNRTLAFLRESLRAPQ